MKRRTMIASAVSALVAQAAEATAPVIAIVAAGACEANALESASNFMAKTFEDAFFKAYNGAQDPNPRNEVVTNIWDGSFVTESNNGRTLIFYDGTPPDSWPRKLG